MYLTNRSLNEGIKKMIFQHEIQQRGNEITIGSGRSNCGRHTNSWESVMAASQLERPLNKTKATGNTFQFDFVLEWQGNDD
jgi:hypothetical protein